VRSSLLTVAGQAGIDSIGFEAVGEVMGPPLPTIGVGEQVQVAVGRLEDAPALLVLDGGHPIGVITRSDVLASLADAARGRPDPPSG